MVRARFAGSSIMFALSFCPCGLAAAQVSGSSEENLCERERAEAKISTAGMSAVIWNENRLFGNMFDNNLLFTATLNVGSLSSFALWVAGTVNGEERISANHFNVSRFLPGKHTGDDQAVDCRSTKIYRVTRGDIERYQRSGILTAELERWPWFLGAPVVDGDGDPSNYTLEGGDLPALHGDDMLWYLMSDYAGRSKCSLDLDVGVSVFVRYDVTNRGAGTIEDAHVAVFATPDIGDEYVGTDTTRSMLFAYGANETIRGTQMVSPAVGVVHIDPASQQSGGGGPPPIFSSYIAVASAYSPDNDVTYLRALDTRRSDSVPILEGGLGFPTTVQCPQSITPVKIMFPGDPLTF